MNENIDLTKILKNCPIGWEFYSSIYGNVTFRGIENDSECPVKFFYINKDNSKKYGSVTEQGLDAPYYNGECTLFPSKDQRDWSKFTAPWLKKERFNPKTLKVFDRVLSRYDGGCWSANLFSHIEERDNEYCAPFSVCNGSLVKFCIPYNDDTKHLVGTKDEAPDFYRYWEN